MELYHPAANIFPMMTDDEFALLLADIKANGLIEPIWFCDGQILDGRNRWKACEILGIAPEVKEYGGDDPIGFVVSLNLNRRHLNSSQRAIVGLEVEKAMAVEAKRRQVVNLKQGDKSPVREIIPQREIGKAADTAAAMVGTNGRYISDAKKLMQTAPELLPEIAAGNMTIPEAKREVKKRQQQIKKEQFENTAAILNIKTMLADGHNDNGVNCHPGDWWRLGNSLLYCGDTSHPEFYSKLPKVAFAFADPPYNAEAADWDNNFNWNHDWLNDKADIVAVTPGIVSIFDFAKNTSMPYKWSLSCWIKNGMTRGAMGFGNWIYTAIFSDGSIYKNSQDFFSITISTSQTDETEHKGRKPTAYMHKIIDTFTNDGDAIIDPFAGSGQTLLCCESLGRICYTGEIDLEFCNNIINRWEKITKEKAIRQ